MNEQDYLVNRFGDRALPSPLLSEVGNTSVQYYYDDGSEDASMLDSITSSMHTPIRRRIGDDSDDSIDLSIQKSHHSEEKTIDIQELVNENKQLKIQLAMSERNYVEGHITPELNSGIRVNENKVNQSFTVKSGKVQFLAMVAEKNHALEQLSTMTSLRDDATNQMLAMTLIKDDLVEQLSESMSSKKDLVNLLLTISGLKEKIINELSIMTSSHENLLMEKEEHEQRLLVILNTVSEQSQSLSAAKAELKTSSDELLTMTSNRNELMKELALSVVQQAELRNELSIEKSNNVSAQEEIFHLDSAHNELAAQYAMSVKEKKDLASDLASSVSVQNELSQQLLEADASQIASQEQLQIASAAKAEIENQLTHQDLLYNLSLIHI